MRIPGKWRLQMAWRALRERRRHAQAIAAVERFPRETQKKSHNLDRPLVVTLTSYPARFGDLDKTLKSLLDQTISPDLVILWLAESDLDELPDSVKNLKKFDLEIRPCADFRSYKKLVPALECFPDSFLVTADDDLYYPKDWLKNLIAPYPGGQIIPCHRMHMAKRRSDGFLLPYNEWELETSRRDAADGGEILFPTGGAGCLYPPGSLDPVVTNEDLFLKLAPNADDVWFFWCARMAMSKHINTPQTFHMTEWPSSQDVALKHDNFFSNGNDTQIRALEEYFGQVP